MKPESRLRVAAYGLLFSGPAFLASTIYASGSDTVFAWLLKYTLGILFVCVAMSAGIVAYKNKSEGLKIGTALACCVFLGLGGTLLVLSGEQNRYANEFQHLATEFSSLYQNTYERYTREGFFVNTVDHNLHGTKLIWCYYDQDRHSLDVRYKGTFSAFLATPGEKADFVLIDHVLPQGELLTAFHISTKRLKSMSLITFKSVKKTDFVIPGPGSWVIHVDEKVWPVGFKNRNQSMTDHEGIKRFIESDVLG